MAIKQKVLITAGPTWVAIDRARVISNIASGQTGFILANQFKKLGKEVTLLLGPGNFCARPKGIRLLKFHYFSELEALLKKELKQNVYQAIIHTAAVSDYRPAKVISEKIDSGKAVWQLKLIPAKKLVQYLKKYRKDAKTVAFKFGPGWPKNRLIKAARGLAKEYDLDLVVANSYKQKKYSAYIIDKFNFCGPFSSKEKMADALVKKIEKA